MRRTGTTDARAIEDLEAHWKGRRYRRGYTRARSSEPGSKAKSRRGAERLSDRGKAPKKKRAARTGGAEGGERQAVAEAVALAP